MGCRETMLGVPEVALGGVGSRIVVVVEEEEEEEEGGGGGGPRDCGWNCTQIGTKMGQCPALFV